MVRGLSSISVTE
jgi:hypothetical protein